MTPPQSHALVDAFLTHLTVERRLATNSVDAYARDLAQLARFASARSLGLEQLSRQMLEAFVRDLMSEGRSPRSVARATQSHGWSQIAGVAYDLGAAAAVIRNLA